MQKQIIEEILEEVNPSLKLKEYEELRGGSVNTAVKVKANSEVFVIKYNHKEFHENFQSEVNNLELIENSKTINTPKIYKHGTTQNHSFLALEYIKEAPVSVHSIRYLAEKMAAFHSVISDQCGLEYNNFIGPFEQNNETEQHWFRFFLEKRIKPMVRKSMQNDLLDNSMYKDFESFQFYKQVETLLTSDGNVLLHGDFWNGNVIYTEREAYLIDPSCYYGSREVDMAFSNLFGGFHPMFYDIYESLLPYQKEYEKRFNVYNIYPLLVHLNLFGDKYLKDIEIALKKIVF